MLMNSVGKYRNFKAKIWRESQKKKKKNGIFVKNYASPFFKDDAHLFLRSYALSNDNFSGNSFAVSVNVEEIYTCCNVFS